MGGGRGIVLSHWKGYQRGITLEKPGISMIDTSDIQLHTSVEKSQIYSPPNHLILQTKSKFYITITRLP